MAQNYYDATGVLMLDRVTPVICALFGSFRLDAAFPGNGQAYIARLSETNDPQWEDVMEGLIELFAGIDLPLPEGEPSMEELLARLATHFGADDNPDLLNLVERHDFDGSAELDALMLIASCFNDGHNLVAIQFEGCWYSSKPRLNEFGGHGCFLSREVNVFTDSSESLKLGSDLRVALVARDIEAAANVVNEHARSLLDGVSDKALRIQVRLRVAELLQRDSSRLSAG